MSYLGVTPTKVINYIAVGEEPLEDWQAFINKDTLRQIERTKQLFKLFKKKRKLLEESIRKLAKNNNPERLILSTEECEQLIETNIIDDVIEFNKEVQDAQFRDYCFGLEMDITVALTDIDYTFPITYTNPREALEKVKRHATSTKKLYCVWDEGKGYYVVAESCCEAKSLIEAKVKHYIDLGYPENEVEQIDLTTPHALKPVEGKWNDEN